MITGHIVRQRLNLCDSHIVADTINYLEAKFIFKTDDWDGLDKWAHFAGSDGTVYDIRLTDNCIRKEDHLNLSAGMWKVYLHGNEFRDGEVVQRITTDEVVLYVIPTGILDGEPFPTVPPSAGEQIIASAAASEAGAKSAADEAGRAAESAKASADLAAKSAETVGNADQIIQDALRDAKESGEFDGEDGITPHIGANGNWFVGATDTGIRAQGKDGAKGDPGDDYILTAEDKQEIAGMIPGGGNVGNVLILVGGASLDNLHIEFVAPPAGVSVDAAYELIGRGLFDVAVQVYSDDGNDLTGVGLLRGMPVGDAVGAIGEFWSNGNVSLVNVTLDFATMTAYAETMYTSSGGGGVVTITQDADGSYTCSHTPAEIAEMAQTGAVVAGVPVTDSAMIILPLIGISYGIAMFEVTFAEDNNIGTMTFFVGDDVVVEQKDANRVAPMTGASAADGGKPGTVPAPSAGQQDAVLHGDGTWRKVAGGGTSVEIDSTLTQPGKAADAKVTGEKIDSLSKAIANHGAWFAVCNTYSSGVRIASTQSGDFELSVGARVGVLMGYDMHGTKLNVDNTGTYPIVSAHYTTTDENGETVDVVNDDIPAIWQAHGQVIWFTFDGAYWIADSSVRATEDTVGVVTISDKIDKTSSTTAASSTAVKAVNDRLTNALAAYIDDIAALVGGDA